MKPEKVIEYVRGAERKWYQWIPGSAPHEVILLDVPAQAVGFSISSNVWVWDIQDQDILYVSWHHLSDTKPT